MALTPLKELPDYTIGWQVLEWCSKWLVNPDAAGGEKGEQWVFKPDQIRFILHFYAVNSKGEWICTQAYRERAKGTGKSPMVAAIACAELVGPTMFSHFDENGKAIGRRNPDPVIWLASTSEAGTDHTYAYVMNMLDGPVREHYGLDVGLTRILVKGHPGAIIRQVTASPKSLTGPKPTFVIAEETQNWLPAEKGPLLMATIALGLQKTNGRRIEVTNAPEPGQGSVAEMTHQKWQAIQAGLEKDPGLLFDTFMISVGDVYDEAQAIPALAEMYKDAPWMPPHLTFARFSDQAYTETDIRRFFFNEIVKPEAMWLSRPSWNDVERKQRLKKTDLIALGFKTIKQCCAITATRLEDNALFLLELWEKPQGADRAWEVPWTQVDGTMRHIFENYNVCYVTASPEGFQEIVGRWAADYAGSITVEELWTSRSRQKTCDAIELFSTAVNSQRLTHDGNADLARHVMNCFTEKVAQGTLIRPETESSTRYITAATAAVLSTYGAQEAIADGLDKEPPSGYLYSF